MGQFDDLPPVKGSMFSDLPPVNPDASRVGAQPAGNFNRSWMQSAVNTIPLLGQVLGAAAGTATDPGLGTVVGGALGRAGGSAAQSLVERIPGLGMSAPTDPTDVIWNAGNQTLPGGASEAAGLPIGWAMGKIAPYFAEAGSGATKAIKQDFPKVNFGEAMLRNKVGSATEASDLLSQRAGDTDRLISAIDSGIGKPHISASDMSKAALDNVEQSLGRSLTPKEQTQVVVQIKKAANQILSDRRMGIGPKNQTMFTLAEVKQIAQETQDALRSQLSQASGMKRSFNASPSVAKALEQGSTAAKNAQPGLAEAEGKTQEAIALARALSGSEAGYSPLTPSLLRGISTSAGAAAGAASHFGNPLESAALGGLFGNLATSPPALRATGFALNDPTLQFMASQSPAGIEALLNFLGGQRGGQQQ